MKQIKWSDKIGRKRKDEGEGKRKGLGGRWKNKLR